MTNFAIFPRDTAGAMLQHITDAQDATSAFEEFSQIIGNHVERDGYAVIEVTNTQRVEIEDWHDAGAPADEAPDWLDDAIRRA